MSDNIILIGPMGAGKTTIGKKLARHLKYPFIDVDETIEKRLGVNIATIFDTEGEAGFRQRELDILRDIINEHQNAVIATGGGCVLTEECRKIIACQRLVVHLDLGLEQQHRRLRMDKKRPILQGGNLREKLIKLREQRHSIYQSLSDLHLMSDRNSFRKMITTISSQLELHQ
ncbi:MAG: shikimate kinase [Gammaproteobacteria bacterium]|nr:shikimate kinase [Gammaproteobacteria bacterium]